MKRISTTTLSVLVFVMLFQLRASSEERQLRLKEYLASGKNSGKLFESELPRFRLSIPGSTKGGWYFIVFDHSPVPFYIVKPKTMDQSLPFISSMIESIPPEQLTLNPNDLFKRIATGHEQWERKQIPDLRIHQPGSAFTLGGLPAYERVLSR